MPQRIHIGMGATLFTLPGQHPCRDRGLLGF